ncbi:MAG: GNAT family N-acetyltransferase [Dehalococcoidia bacterium]|nr:GNAT family N-acetyltransferase [Dehalococcoidia bacterium]
MNGAPAELNAGPLQLRDGRRVWFRPILPGDAAPLRRFHRRLSAETQRLRFFTPLRELSKPMADRFTTVDFEDRVAVVVVYPGEDELRGVARYEVIRPGEAEVAFVLEDDLQGHGLGRELLYLLAGYARDQGITKFTANVLPENGAMLSVFRHAGFPATFRLIDGSEYVEMDISEVPYSPRVLCSLPREQRHWELAVGA